MGDELDQLAYLDKLFINIQENAKTLADNDHSKLKQLLKLSNAFYLSLFSATKSKGMTYC